MYPTHAGPIGCILLMLWPHKYKVDHIDLILMKHQNLHNLPKIPEYSCVSHYFLKNRTNCDLEDKLSPVYNMASSGLKKILDCIILYTHKCIRKCVSCNFVLDTKKTNDMS